MITKELVNAAVRLLNAATLLEKIEKNNPKTISKFSRDCSAQSENKNEKLTKFIQSMNVIANILVNETKPASESQFVAPVCGEPLLLWLSTGTLVIGVASLSSKHTVVFEYTLNGKTFKDPYVTATGRRKTNMPYVVKWSYVSEPRIINREIVEG